MKKWIKWLGGFMAFMWFCTIVSKSIYVSKLPQVRVEKPVKRNIEHVVEANGTVTAGAKQAVNLISGLRVSEICIQEGEYVEKGDILLRMDLDDLSGMIATKEAELMKLQYQLADTQFNQILESQKKEITLLWAQEDYVTADEKTTREVSRAQEALRAAENDWKSHLATSVPHTSDEERKKAWDAYHNWKNDYYKVQDEKTEKERVLLELKVKLEMAEELSEEEMESLKENISEAENEIMALTDKMITLERNMVEMPDYSMEESKYDAWQEKKSNLEDTIHHAKQTLEDAKANKVEMLRDKLRATASAEILSHLDSTMQIQGIEIAAIQKELGLLYEMRDKKGEVKADKSGYVLDVQSEVGNRTDDSAAILLTDESQPYQFSFSVTKEEGKYLELEDSIELRIKGKKYTVKVDYMEENSNAGYDVTCKLGERIEKPGVSGSIYKAKQGEPHYVTLPVEALKEESKSYFIYVLKEKMGILGKEYYVEKIKVAIADQNDKFVALEEGAISAEAQVIVYCSKEIKQGESVRLVEE